MTRLAELGQALGDLLELTDLGRTFATAASCAGIQLIQMSLERCRSADRIPVDRSTASAFRS